MAEDIAWASRLSERILIEQPIATGDELGGQAVIWNTLASLWAEIVPLTGAARERAATAQMQAQAGYRVRIRLRVDVDARMRVRWKERVLSIHSLHERGAILEMLTYEEGL